MSIWMQQFPNFAIVEWQWQHPEVEVGRRLRAPFLSVLL